MSKLFRKHPKETIELFPDGFVLRRNEEQFFRIAWGDVREIVTFKRDLLTTDCVCLAFRIVGASMYYEINEEIPGFGRVADSLTEVFPEIPRDWFNAVTQPAFATNFTRLFGEPPRAG